MPEMDGFTLAERIKKNPEFAEIPVMMLTSASRSGDATRCKEIGIDGYLRKPVKRSELLDAITVVLGRPTPERKRPPLVTRHSLRKSQALAALSADSFDLVLMDVQMPKMNGLEAAAAIREKEKETGSHIPIIAMTAHAMKEDRRRCLEAGMDDYIPKPFEFKQLFEVIEGIVSPDN
jgi:CheY-like chemotaxis protein